MKQRLNPQALLSVILKLIVIGSALTGTYMSGAGSRNSFMGGSSVFMYFTIQSNIALAIICLTGLILLLMGKCANRTGQLIKLMGTVSITLTGMVFCFVLAPTMSAGAWSLPNILTHVIVPIVSVLDFFVVAHHYPYQKKDTVWVILPPLLYACYAGIGYIQGWEFAPGVHYPYFFLNWGSEAGAFGFSNQLPFMGCMWWILLLLVFLIFVAFIYLMILYQIRRVIDRRT